MSAITVYSPKHEVVFKDGTVLYIDSDRVESFHKNLETASFVKIGDSIYNKFEISKVVRAGESVSKLESLLATHDESVRIKVRQTVKQWRNDNPTKEITDGIIQNMIAKYSNV